MLREIQRPHKVKDLIKIETPPIDIGQRALLMNLSLHLHA